jgi:hypothetical protein
MRAPLPCLSLCIAILVAASVACQAASFSKRELIAGIDEMCKCTGLQRKSGLLSLTRDKESAVVSLSADGVSERYRIQFFEGHPAFFGPENYKPHWGQPRVKSVSQRKLCLRVIQRLEKCEYNWGHFGEAEIRMDTPRGFRVRYLSSPKPAYFSTSGNVFFLITPKGTVCSIWWGENYTHSSNQTMKLTATAVRFGETLLMTNSRSIQAALCVGGSSLSYSR